MLRNTRTKMGTYLAVSAGVSCVAGSANGAVIFYGDGVAAPGEISFTSFISKTGGLDAYVLALSDPNTFFARAGRDIVTEGTDLSGIVISLNNIGYLLGSTFDSGAVLGDQNYANITFNGDDNVYESVAQFNFDGLGGGYLVAVATSANGTDALSISAGKAQIDAAVVPEPSSLALLGLGSLGLLARRRRKVAL